MTLAFDHQVFSFQAAGGVSRYFAELYRGLPAFGVTPRLDVYRTPTQALHDLDPAKFRPFLKGIDFRGKARLLEQINLRAVRKAWKRTPPAVFHPTYFDPWFLPLVGEVPWVVTVHDMTHELFPEGLVDVARTTANKRRLVEAASAVVAVSEATKADLVRLFGVDPARVTVIPHGLSLTPEAVRPRNEAVAFPFVLYVGQRHGYKNWDLLVRAVGQLADRSIGLICVGGGRPTEAESRLFREAGLEGRVAFVTADDETLAGYYAQALCLAYPSRYEGFGLPLLEAMAWGCPVVASRTPALVEVGADAAVYAAPDSEEEWVAALTEAAGSPGRRADRAAAGRRRAAAFSWAASCSSHADLYRQLLT